MIYTQRLLHLVLFWLLTGSVAQAATTLDSLDAIAQRWAQINYQMAEKQQDAAFGTLTEQVSRLLRENPRDAQLLTWRGIIEATHAGVRGGIGALSLVKSARRDLERALEIDERVLNGAAHTTLGSLYSQVPPWPISFGSDKKAAKHLQRGLHFGPEDIDANYFYAKFLHDQGDDASARRYIDSALGAASRPGRRIAYQGRQIDIRELLSLIGDG